MSWKKIATISGIEILSSGGPGQIRDLIEKKIKKKVKKNDTINWIMESNKDSYAIYKWVEDGSL